MFDIHRKEIDWGGRTLVLETGRLARQADGAVLVTYGDTTVLCTVVARKEPRAGQLGEQDLDVILTHRP
jgi:polyribonucleotide nucleotidyltransferase